MRNIAVVEDEPEAAGELKSCLERYAAETGEKFHIQYFENAVILLSNYRSNYDIIFMDIELPHMNGMESCHRIRELDEAVTIIFVTNMAQYAVKGYEVDAFDFIVKPLSYVDFSIKLKRALDRIRRMDGRSIVLTVKGGLHRINAVDIKYVEIMKHQMLFHTVNGNFDVYGTLKKVEKDLPEDTFARCSNCCLVNLRYVERVDGYCVTVGGEPLQISRAKKKEFMLSVSQYLASNL